jgi:hypothetical protein
LKINHSKLRGTILHHLRKISAAFILLIFLDSKNGKAQFIQAPRAIGIALIGGGNHYIDWGFSRKERKELGLN